MPTYMTMTDRQGTKVTISEKSWQHVTDGHPELMGCEDFIRRTVGDPDLEAKSATPARNPDGERWVCSRHEPTIRRSRPHLWVVIEYSPRGNWVPTAYLNALPPPGEYRFVRLLSAR